MKYKFNPKTGRMEQVVSPAKEIARALIPVQGNIPQWHGIRTIRDGVKILYTNQYYLAIKFNGQWRLLGTIINMPTIEKYLKEPLVNFHDAWLRGTPIDEPTIK